MNPQSNDVEQGDFANTVSLPPVQEMSDTAEIDSAAVSRSGSERQLVVPESLNTAVESNAGMAPKRGSEVSDAHRRFSAQGSASNEIDEIRPANEWTPGKQYSKRQSYQLHQQYKPLAAQREAPPKQKRGLKHPLKRMTEQDNVEQEGRVEPAPAEDPLPVEDPPATHEEDTKKTPLWKRLSSRTNSKMSLAPSQADRSGFLGWGKPGIQPSFKASGQANETFKSPKMIATVRDLMEQAKSYKPPTLEEQSRHGVSRNSVDGVALSDDDEPTEKRWRVRSFLPYFFAFCVIFLAVFDNIALLALQVFRTEGDWLCTMSEPAAIHYSNLHITIAILCYHAVILCSLIMTKSWASLQVRVFGLAREGGHGAYTLVMFCSVILLIVHCRLCAAHSNGPLDFCTMSDSYRMIRRLHLLVHLFRGMVAIDSCFLLKQEITRRLQTAVSSNKRRYIDHEMKLDLDLTYVCDRIIAMALPCVAGAMYRNDIREVAHFFAMHHYGRFKVFNLCEAYEEKGNGNYDRLLLFNQVERISMRDHHICPLRVFVAFMEHASTWMDRDEANVVAIHCLGGKGRTGAFVCGLMMWTNMFRHATDAMSYYAGRRTDRARGKKRVQSVSAPCQIRYLYYLEAVLRFNFNYLAANRRIVTKVEVRGAELKHLEKGAIAMVIESPLGIEYDHCKAYRLQRLKEMGGGEEGEDEWIRTFDVGEVLVGHDIAVRFYYFDEKVNITPLQGMAGEISPGGRGIRYGNAVAKRLMEVTFHTAFHDVDQLEFSRDEVDGAHNQSISKFPSTFKVVVHFSPDAVAKNPSPTLQPLPDQFGSATSFSNLPPPNSIDGGSGPHTPRALVDQVAPSPLEAIPSGLTLDGMSDSDSVAPAAAGEQLGCALGCLRHKDYLPFLYSEASAARRAADRRGLLYRIFGRCSAPLRTFYRGEVICGDSDEETWPSCSGRSVFLIVKGAVAMCKTYNMQEEHSSLNAAILGEGELIGIREFLLGMERGKSGLVAKARTDRVLVRHLTAKPDETAGWGIQHVLDTIEGTPNKDPNRPDSDSDDELPGVPRSRARRGSAGSLGRTGSSSSSASKGDLFPFSFVSEQPPPLRFENLGPADVYILYEELLYELALRSHSLEKLEISMAVQSDEVKVASEISTGQAEKVNLTRLVRQKFDIPIMEGCALSLLANMSIGNNKEGADDAFSSSNPGRLLIFSQRVCYMDTSKEVQILVSDIVRCDVSGDYLQIELVQQRAPPPPGHAPDPKSEGGTVRELSVHSESGQPILSDMAKRTAFRSRSKRNMRSHSRSRSPLTSGQSIESTDSDPNTPMAMESGMLGEGSTKSASRRFSAAMNAHSNSQRGLPGSLQSDNSEGRGSSKLPAMSFGSSEKLVGTGIRNTTVTPTFRSSLAVFKRETSDDSNVDQNILQFRLQDQPKCQAACNMITRMMKGLSMFTVAPTRPELPIVSMPMMEGDTGGFMPSDVVELFNYVAPNEIVPKETMNELEKVFEQALGTSNWFTKEQIVAKFGQSDTGMLHVLHGCLSIRFGQDPKGTILLKRAGGSVMCERFLHATGNGGLDYTIVAEEDTLCFFVKFEMLEGLAARSPDVAARIYRAMAVLVAKRDQQLLMDLYIGSTQKP